MTSIWFHNKAGYLQIFCALRTQDRVGPGNKDALTLQFSVFSSVMYVGPQQTVILLLS